MCLIIDANKAASFVNEPKAEDHLPIHQWLRDGGQIAFGGKLTAELNKVAKMRHYLVELWRKGQALRYADTVVYEEQQRVTATGLCTSDDPHVIALARVSGARRLFSHDGDLTDDFRNSALLPNPRGKVYRRAEHRHLLDDAPKCRPCGKKKPSPEVVR